MNPEYEDYGDDDLTVPAEGSADYPADYGYGYQQQPYVDPTVVQGLASTMRSIAAAEANRAAYESLAGPLGRLTAEAEQRETRRITEMVDEAVDILGQRLPGFDPRDAEFVRYAERHGVGEGVTSASRLADELEEAAAGFQTIRGRAERADQKRQRDEAFARIKAAPGPFRIGRQ